MKYESFLWVGAGIYQDDDFVTIEVADKGKGETDVQKRIFEPFYTTIPVKEVPV